MSREQAHQVLHRLNLDDLPELPIQHEKLQLCWRLLRMFYKETSLWRGHSKQEDHLTRNICGFVLLTIFVFSYTSNTTLTTSDFEGKFSRADEEKLLRLLDLISGVFDDIISLSSVKSELEKYRPDNGGYAFVNLSLCRGNTLLDFLKDSSSRWKIGLTTMPRTGVAKFHYVQDIWSLLRFYAEIEPTNAIIASTKCTEVLSDIRSEKIRRGLWDDDDE